MNLQDTIKRWMKATKGKFVTIEGKPVFVGGPGQGAGGSSGDMTMTTQEATGLIANDLANAGFNVSQSGNVARVNLVNRPVSTMEVAHALDQSGYENSQFQMAKSGDGVLVRAII